MLPSTITLTIATGADRILNRVNQDNYGSEYKYSDATEAISMKIRHSVDSVDSDGITMMRHNVFVERVVYPTPVALMKKFTSTVTLRHGKTDDPAASAAITKGLATWISGTTILADLAVGVN